LTSGGKEVHGRNNERGKEDVENANMGRRSLSRKPFEWIAFWPKQILLNSTGTSNSNLGIFEMDLRGVSRFPPVMHIGFTGFACRPVYRVTVFDLLLQFVIYDRLYAQGVLPTRSGRTISDSRWPEEVSERNLHLDDNYAGEH